MGLGYFIVQSMVVICGGLQVTWLLTGLTGLLGPKRADRRSREFFNRGVA